MRTPWLAVALVLAGLPVHGQKLGSFSNGNGGGSGSNSIYNAQLYFGTNCVAPQVSGASVTGSNCFLAGSIAVNAANIGVPDVINAGNNANFSQLAGFFDSVAGASFMANVAMGNGGAATNSGTIASQFGGANPPFPGDVVTSFVYTLTSIPVENSGLVIFDYTFEIDGTTGTPEPATPFLLGSGMAAIFALALWNRRTRRSGKSA